MLNHAAVPLLLLRTQQDLEKQALQNKQAAFMTEVEEWSQGEVEALQAAAAERLKQEQQMVKHWYVEGNGPLIGIMTCTC